MSRDALNKQYQTRMLTPKRDQVHLYLCDPKTGRDVAIFIGKTPDEAIKMAMRFAKPPGKKNPKSVDPPKDPPKDPPVDPPKTNGGGADKPTSGGESDPKRTVPDPKKNESPPKESTPKASK